MMNNYVHRSKYFYGNKISEYGLENGYIDYKTLAKSFEAILNNNIIQSTYDIGYWERENGFIDNSEAIEELEEQIEAKEEIIEALEERIEAEENIEYCEEQIEILKEQIEELEAEQNENQEIFQYYIISYNGAEILKELTNEIVFYNDTLDMYVWGVTHFGTSWDYVLTDIKIELEEMEG